MQISFKYETTMAQLSPAWRQWKSYFFNVDQIFKHFDLQILIHPAS